MPSTTLADLSLLRDIHVPAPISWWPIAPGWWFLLIFIIISGLVIRIAGVQFYLNRQDRREALRELAQLEKQHQNDMNSQWCAAELSKLLKRVALVYYPRTEVAGLYGDAWISFLNRTGKGIHFNSVRMQLLELPWRSCQYHNLEPLFKLARQWIMRQKKSCSN